MRYVAAYLLAVLGGNDQPSESDIKKILSSVGINADVTRVNKVISELRDKKLEELIAAGQAKLAVMPTAGVALAPAAAAAVKVEEPKKVEKNEEMEPEEDDDDDLGFGLFD